MHSLRENQHFTIWRTLVGNEPFGTHKCVPYEHNRTNTVHSRKHNIADENPYAQSKNILDILVYR